MAESERAKLFFIKNGHFLKSDWLNALRACARCLFFYFARNSTPTTNRCHFLKPDFVIGPTRPYMCFCWLEYKE